MNIYEKMQADAEAYRRIQSLTSNPTPLDDPSQLAALYDTVHSLVGRVAILESRLATSEERLATAEMHLQALRPEVHAINAEIDDKATPSPRRPRIRPCNCRVHLHRP